MARKKADDINAEVSVDKAEQILAGGMQEFLTHGYAATSMDRVAAAAGVSKATVYSHFHDKEGLFAALVKRLAKRSCPQIFSCEPPQGNPEIVLRHLATDFLMQMMTDDEQLAFVRLMIGESERFPKLAQIFIENITKPALEFLSEYLAAQTDLKIADPEAIARIMIGSLIYYMTTQKMMHGKDIIPMPSDRLIDSLMQLIFKH